MDENDVKLRERVTKLEADLDNEVKQREKLADIIEEMRDMVGEIRRLRVDFNTINNKVDNLQEKPAKRWEAVIAGIIGAIAGGIGSALIGLLLR